MKYKNMINKTKLTFSKVKTPTPKIIIILLLCVAAYYVLNYYSVDVTVFRKKNEIYALEAKHDRLMCELGRYMEEHGKDGAVGLMHCADRNAGEIVAMGREFSDKFAQ